MTYDFNYTDNEGDEFQSNDHNSLSEARTEMKRLDEAYDGDMRVTETWIYDDEGEFQGRW